MSYPLTDREEYSKWKVPDLRKELKIRGLSTDGKKNDLIERLQLAVGDSALLDDTVNDHDELLDEDVLTDEEPLEESELTKPDTPDEKLEKEISGTGLKRKASENNDKQPKKIVLNRNTVVLDKEVNKNLGKENKEKEEDTSGEKAKIVKVGVLNAQERLEKRAAKFGVTMSNEAKKEARAARFGLPSAGSKVGGLVSTNVDLLKKRAQRFGTTLPGSILEKAEIEERRKKREERFGKVDKSSPAPKVAVQGSTSEEKKRQRAERFKITS